MGNLSSLTHLGNPNAASSLMYIYTLAGKIIISKSIIPHAANEESWGTQSKTPSIISEAPLTILIVLGAGNTGGIIFTYNRGTLKWFMPARIYRKAIRYKE